MKKPRIHRPSKAAKQRRDKQMQKQSSKCERLSQLSDSERLVIIALRGQRNIIASLQSPRVTGPPKSEAFIRWAKGMQEMLEYSFDAFRMEPPQPVERPKSSEVAPNNPSVSPSSCKACSIIWFYSACESLRGCAVMSEEGSFSQSFCQRRYLMYQFHRIDTKTNPPHKVRKRIMVETLSCATALSSSLKLIAEANDDSIQASAFKFPLCPSTLD